MCRGHLLARIRAGALTALSLSSIALGSVAARAEGATRDQSPRPPNLLVVTFDTTRADRLRCYGYEGAQMLSLDRLAGEGVLFERAYCQAVQTLPSHASLFTGLYPATLSVVSNGQKLDHDAVTLAEILSNEGYRTGAIVAIAPLMKRYGLDQGFATYDDHFRQPGIVRGFKAGLRFLSFGKVNLPSTRPAHHVAELAMTWLTEAAADDSPFFLWVHFADPHHPYLAHPDFSKPGEKRKKGRRNRYGKKEANYVNEIEFADHYLGKVLGHLDDFGLTDSTLTVFAADHGESLGEHGYRGHRKEVYEQVIHVPLIMRLPGRVPAGARLRIPAMLIDVVPSILRLMGLAVEPRQFEGKDLFALSEQTPRRVYSAAVKLFTRSPTRIAMIDGDHKYILFGRRSRNAVFNIHGDPGELHNLLTESGAHAIPIKNWQTELQSWWDGRWRYEPADFPLSEEDQERLRSLGYTR
jgi:arylsulfatase A-like enzyme